MECLSWLWFCVWFVLSDDSAVFEWLQWCSSCCCSTEDTFRCVWISNSKAKLLWLFFLHFPFYSSLLNSIRFWIVIEAIPEAFCFYFIIIARLLIGLYFFVYDLRYLFHSFHWDTTAFDYNQVLFVLSNHVYKWKRLLSILWFSFAEKVSNFLCFLLLNYSYEEAKSKSRIHLTWFRKGEP